MSATTHPPDATWGVRSNAQLVAALLGLSESEGALIVADGLRSIGDIPMRRGRSVKLRTAIELGSRVASETARAGIPGFRLPGDCARFLLPLYSTRPVETFGLLALDTRHRLKRDVTISVGCLTATLVHPREVFHAAVSARAASIVLYHNHPSGDPEPSAEDIASTRRLAAGGTLLGIEVLDHIILGAGRYVSLKDRGIL